MVLQAFIISISANKYERTVKELAKVGVRGVLFPGVDGKRNRTSPQVLPFCAQFCTDKMIGCGLAHIRLAQYIATHCSDNDYSLVVEDDIRNPVADLVKQLARVVRESEAGWDVITLFCQGWCTTPTIFAGSLAAYLLSRSGAQKLARFTLAYHLDIQWRSLNRQLGPILFDTYDNKMPPIILRQSWVFWAHQHLIRLGGWDVTVGHACTLLLLILCLVILFMIWRRRFATSVVSRSR